ncbi:MAG: hypothetical protein J2P57_17595, partial [Acidimicrobiaceae bacterium]|nr:hypothetical protein [Acidimicrobiaceae bacterium]
TANGYLYLALATAGTYLVIIQAIAVLNHRENLRTWRVPRWAALRMHAHAHVVTLVLTGILVTIGSVALPRSAEAIVGRPPAHLWGGSSAAGPSRTPTTATARELAFMDPKVARNLARQPMVVTLPDDRPFLGAYDPNGADTRVLDAEEVFIPLNSSSSDLVTTEVRRILRLGRVPIVTLEPWPWEIDGMTTETLLTDLTAGRYDTGIQSVARTMATFAPTVIYLRFAQEMDLTGFWPWAQGDPAAFIAAWRHFVQTFRAAGAHNVRMVWSPTGRSGSYEFYPGGDFVDVIGCTALAAEEWESKSGPVNQTQTFVDLVHDGYTLASRLGKPLIVAEAGVSATDPAVSMQWLQQARAAMARLPLLLGVVYFNAPNSLRNTPLGTQVADWTLSPAEWTAFFELHTKE